MFESSSFLLERPQVILAGSLIPFVPPNETRELFTTPLTFGTRFQRDIEIQECRMLRNTRGMSSGGIVVGDMASLNGLSFYGEAIALRPRKQGLGFSTGRGSLGP